MTPAIELRQVSFEYDESVPVVVDADLRIQRGEFWGVVGPNGGGKSTLIRLVLGLLSPSQGDIQILGMTPTQAQNRVGYVPQVMRFDREFPMRIEDLVLMGRIGMRKLGRRYTKEDVTRCHAALDTVGMFELRERALAEVSGGQLQRAVIARALVSDPELLVLDEPTANIDPQGEKSIVDLLSDMKGKTTILMVTHDIAYISHHVDYVACVNRRLYCHDPKHIDGNVLDSIYGGHVHAIEHNHTS